MTTQIKTIFAQGTAPTRTLTTRRNRQVVTSFTDAEAWSVLEQIKGNNFAADLASRGIERMSTEQMIWVHILAVENSVRPAQSAPVALAGIVKVFNAAAETLQGPNLRLMTEAGVDLRIEMSTSMRRDIYVTSGEKNEWGRRKTYGRITQSGEWIPTTSANDDVTDLLTAFDAEPAKVAAQYGKLTCKCSFCSRRLSDERSVALGYGPRCAQVWGLEWGKKAADAKAIAVAA